MNNPIDSDGRITSWSVYAGRINRELILKIYRATGDPDVFKVVGTSDVVIPDAGLNTWMLDEPIIVKAGDYVGFRIPHTNPLNSGGAVDYHLFGSVRFNSDIGQDNTYDPQPGDLVTMDRTGPRTYSLQVNGYKLYVGGTVTEESRLEIMAPWLALGIVFTAGGAIYLRRRSTHIRKTG